MPRLASLYFPLLPIERIGRKDGRLDLRSSPERGGGSANGSLPSSRKTLTPQEDAAARADCSCPRGGGWRPGARWAENSKERAKLVALKGRMAREREVEVQIAALPAHQRPQMRELGRRSEAAPVAYRSPEQGGGSGQPKRRGLITGESLAANPLRRGFDAPPSRAGEVQATVTAHRAGQKVVIAAACPRATALGLAPGMALTQARVLVPGLIVHDADHGADAALLARIALHAARRWTPRAAVADAFSIVMDLSGVAHLFGGEASLCAAILRFCARRGLTARIAVADTLGAAHALVCHADRPVTLCPAGAQADAVADLPVAALRLDEAALGTASRLGLERIGDLFAMPRGPLQRRFGPLLLRRLDQASGRLAEPIDPLVPADPPSVLLRFMEPIASAEAIAEAMAEALRRLLHNLQEAGLAVRSLRLACQRVDGDVQEIGIGTARATRDGAHLLRLLLPKIETINPGFGIERLRLTARRVEPLGAQPIAGGLSGEPPPADLAPLIDQLTGRLGTQRLYRIAAVESDVPERSVRRVGPLEPATGWPLWPRPVRLLRRPERIEGVVALLPDQPPRRFTWRGRAYRVTRADGPERIHGEWWRRRAESAAVRDYFQVEDEGGARFWLFRRGDGVDARTGDLSWWMQGMMG